MKDVDPEMHALVEAEKARLNLAWQSVDEVEKLSRRM